MRRDRDSNPKAVISDLPIFKIGSSSSRILSKNRYLRSAINHSATSVYDQWRDSNPRTHSFRFMWANHSIFICKNYGRAFHRLMSVSRINPGVLLVLFRVFQTTAIINFYFVVPTCQRSFVKHSGIRTQVMRFSLSSGVLKLSRLLHLATLSNV